MRIPATFAALSVASIAAGSTPGAQAQVAAPPRPKADWRQTAPALQTQRCKPRLTGRWRLVRSFSGLDTRQVMSRPAISFRDAPLDFELANPTLQGTVETYRGSARGGIFTPGDVGRVTVHFQPSGSDWQVHLYVRFPTGLSRGSPDAGADETYAGTVRSDGSVHPIYFWIQGTTPQGNPASWRLLGRFPCAPRLNLHQLPPTPQ